MFFHLFCVFFNFSHECSVVPGAQIFTYLVRSIPRHLMVFGAIVKGIDSLISLFIFSFFVYKKATDFCPLILYPALLLNCCMSSSNLRVESFQFST